MKTFIILTSAAEHLAESLRKKGKNFELILPKKNKEGQRFFPDGEVYMRVSEADSLKQKRVIVLHSGAPNPNDGLIELELALQILKNHKIKSEVFFTYFPYSRQDKIFQLGEINAAENLIQKIVNYYKVKKIYIVDPHFGGMRWLKKYPIISISGIHLLMQKTKEDFGQDVLFLSPDKGGERRTGISGLNKKRINSFEVKTLSSKISMKGKTIGVVDDIIGTGGTLLRFYEFAKKSGAKKVIALIAHGALDSGIQRIRRSFVKLYLTNTINRKEANVDITDLIAKAIKI